MSIERLIESIGLSPAELKRYLLTEIDEFLEAQDDHSRASEFGDILFALSSMAWAHSGRHYRMDRDVFEPKVRQRLRNFGAITRHPRKYLPDEIQDMSFGVVHFAFGHFGAPWHEYTALRSGTVAELQLLTDLPFQRSDRLTNHCLITFADTDGLEYELIYDAGRLDGGNVVACRVPNFMFVRAKRDLRFSDFADYLSLQVLAALDGLRTEPGAIAHFHSWESGFLTESQEFRSRMNAFGTIFSPYLTAARLRSVAGLFGGTDWTLTPEEMEVAEEYERKLTAACMRVVLESSKDYEFYGRWVHPDRIEVRSFAQERYARYPTAPTDDRHLSFLAGGRPVREKGFVELCREFAGVRDWARVHGISVSLEVLCRERRRDKGAAYIEAIEREIQTYGLGDIVRITHKIPLDPLRERIAASTALIAPSLYDPYGLMTSYAVEVRRPAFVSIHAGVSENVRSREFTFDPRQPGDLVRAVARWYETRPDFVFESRFPSYRDLYISREVPEPWA